MPVFVINEERNRPHGVPKWLQSDVRRRSATPCSSILLLYTLIDLLFNFPQEASKVGESAARDEARRLAAALALCHEDHQIAVHHLKE